VLQTPLGTLWVWLAFAEPPATLTLVGGAIVLAAVVADMMAPHATSTTAIDSIRSGSPA
jgi:drug/metabolite transporter (DMT)-like permease